jgi:zinc transport system substrate-binding protein
MEPWAHDVLKAVGQKNIEAVEVVAGDNDSGSHDEEDGHDGEHGDDPHIWLDLKLAAEAAELIGSTLEAADPVNGSHYSERTRDLAGRLRQMDARFTKVLASCQGRKLVTGGHSAFGHMAERYGLEQAPLYGISPDAEPSPRRLAEVARMIRAEGVKTVFFEELVNPRLAQVLAEETGARTLLLNPGANLTTSQFSNGLTFMGLMEQNLENLKKGLSCE